MAPVAWCWCSHCGVARRLRREGDYASCNCCGKVLLQLRGDTAAATATRAPARPRRQPRPRVRRAKKRAVVADAAGGGGVVAGDKSRSEASDAESNTPDN